MKTVINKYNFFTIGFLVLFGFQVSWCQTYSSDESDSVESKTELNGTEVSQNFFNSYFDASQNQNLNTVSGNSLSISQVSSFNVAVVKVASRASDINLVQNGASNQAALYYKVDTVVADIEQNGNNNAVLDYVINPDSKVSLDLKQNGDGLSFERFGVNDISKNIKFTQTEASPTVIIRSFK